MQGSQPTDHPNDQDDEPTDQDDDRFGTPGRPISRAHPFYLGFVGALGVLLAIGLSRVLLQLSQESGQPCPIVGEP